MFVRVIVLVAVALELAAIALSSSTPELRTALAQDDADLLATVEALQAQVADQDARIAKLEEDVALLLAANTSANTDASTSTEAQEAVGETQTITGSVFLHGPDRARDVGDLTFTRVDMGDTDYCTGSGGFSDLTGGMRVIVMNGSGDTIAVGEGQPGVHHQDDDTCEFAFTVEDVPESDFYVLRIGNREGPTYTFEELAAMNWRLSLSIG